MNSFIGAFKAEVIKLTQPRALMFTSLGVVAFAAIATAVAFLSAEAEQGAQAGRGTSLQALSEAGGGTEAFALGATDYVRKPIDIRGLLAKVSNWLKFPRS
jgi:CheY-like chemotaxis protein